MKLYHVCVCMCVYFRPVEVDFDSDSPDEDNFEDALNADEDMFAESSSQNRLKLLSKIKF